tara:strand:- start:631 stop:1113 length:483 start_codon:yes stop_codon:yes gene_type:complete
MNQPTIKSLKEQLVAHKHLLQMLGETIAKTERDLQQLLDQPNPPLPRLNADVGNEPQNTDLLDLFQDAPEPVQEPCPGEGIIRRKDTLSNKSYHGVTQEDIDNPKKHLSKYWKPGYFGEYPSNVKLPKPQWSTYDHAKFCTNCVMIKKNKQTTVYQCLGH